MFSNDISFLSQIEESFDSGKQSLYFYNDDGLLSYVAQNENFPSKSSSSLIIYGTVMPNSSKNFKY